MSNLLAHNHIPHPDKRQPISTYRLQLQPNFGFAKALEILPYLQTLGVTDVYLSPILQAAPGSTHGYDVVDHSKVSAELGGEDGFVALASEIHRRGMGVIVDVVPNHMAFPTPFYHNHQIWSVLRYGAESPYANWFDLDATDTILLPILGNPIGKVLTDNQIEVCDLETEDPEIEPQRVLRYGEHVFPLADGTQDLPLEVLLESQNYRLAHWEITNEELNYRRFFDVGNLVGLRVEDLEVFNATHAKILELAGRGLIDGLRIDHSDGLADPAKYLANLREHTDGLWVVTEKILADNEDLPASWQITGTTGYDCSSRLDQLMLDPRGALPLGILLRELSKDVLTDYPEVVKESKRFVLNGSLRAEVNRLANLAHTVCTSDIRLRDITFRALQECVIELIVAMNRYRTYRVPGEDIPPSTEPILTAAAQSAKEALPERRHETLDILLDLLLGKTVGADRLAHMDELTQLQVSFQQVCGAAMAKGVEDTAFYRWTHLSYLCEVGGNPGRFGMSRDDFHDWAAQMQNNWPVGMTCLSTHDSKRSEDTRAQMSVISHDADAWISLVHQVRHLSLSYRPATLHGGIENLIYQTIAATWEGNQPIAVQRLQDYIRKSAREQKLWTSWVAPAQEREHEVLEFASNLLADPAVLQLFQDWHSSHLEMIRAMMLGIKTLQLMAPGVADNYQGCESVRRLLVDPDNRVEVDFVALSRLLGALDEGAAPRNLEEEKLFLTAALLRLRRDLPDCFASPQATYQPLALTASSAVAFARGNAAGQQVICLVPLTPLTDMQHRRWRDALVVIPPGTWESVLTSTVVEGGGQRLAEILTTMPLEVLRKVESA